MTHKNPITTPKFIIGFGVIFSVITLMIIIFGILDLNFYKNKSSKANKAPIIGIEVEGTGASSSSVGLMPPSSTIGQDVTENSFKLSTAIPTTSNSDTEKKIIKYGELVISIENIEETVQEIKDLALQQDGFVENLSISGEPNEFKTATMTIRVQKDKFSETLDEIKSLAVKVHIEQERQDDTTDRILDLEAQIKNLEQTESQYQQILKTATKVEDILKITEQLNSVRLQIEQLKATSQKLTTQVDLAAITIEMDEQIDVSVFGIQWRPLYELKQAFRAGLESLIIVANTIFGLIATLPAIAIFVAVILFAAWAGAEIFLRLNIIGYIKKIIEKLGK